MAKQLVNTGTSANSKDGDSIRTAFTKINSNFNELYSNVAIGPGKTIYVTTSGSNTNDGTTVISAFATIKHALSQADSGDIVLIGSGTFVEIFPLTVPSGVNLKGAGLRATIVKPTTATKDKDAFLLSGQTTVEEMTIQDMFYNVADNTGYAFRFAPNTVINVKSPYVQRVTVLNKGSNPTTTDPYGFLSADAGRGALLDGSLVSRTSLEAAILFNECTFIVPNSRALIITNGARCEWLNCFTYFADQAIEGVVGATGRAGDGKTYLSLQTITGIFSAGETITYYDVDGTTVLATAVIQTKQDADSFVLDGSVAGFTPIEDRTAKTVSVSGTAQLSTAQSKFGTASLSLPGGSSYINLASNSDFGYGTGNFTVEFWWRPTALGLQQVLFDQRSDFTEVAVYLDMNASGNIRLFVNGVFRITSDNTCTALAWNHVAVSRASGITRLFVNGVLTTSTYADSNNYASKPVRVGSSYAASSSATGYIDELRITKGFSRYSTTFTPSATSFRGDSKSVLLLHFNGTNGSTSILDEPEVVLDIRSNTGATAEKINRYDRAEFAAELRAIAGANVYGNNGVKADGVDVSLHLMAHNFAYIGTGADLSNDKSAVVQANEVIEVNGGRVYYDAVDQDGNYRIGDLFTVDFSSGTVSFQGPNFDVSSLTGINFTDGTNTTVVNPQGIETGNLVLAGNTLSAVTGGITINAGTGSVLTINGDPYFTGNVTIDGIPRIITVAPASSVGINGDVEGMVAFDSLYIYYCTGTYDGVTNIWRRVAWSMDTW